MTSNLTIGNTADSGRRGTRRGGRVAQITADGTALLVAESEAHEPSPLAWGSYPMVPWAGRIRHGRFRFDGEDYSFR